MKSAPALLLFVFSLLLIGCHHGPDPVGKWKGSFETTSAGANDPAAQLAKQMLGNITLELKSDKTFTMNALVPIEGTWTQSGNTITCTITKAMGMDKEQIKKAAAAQGKSTADADKPMILTISDDGKSLTAQSTSMQKGTMTFTRDAG